MLRLSRVRAADPALLKDDSKRWQGRRTPSLDVEFYRLSPEALAEELPAYDVRKAMLARDPLACSEGFRALVQLTLQHLLGVRCCAHCPSCAISSSPCMDAFGSNAIPTGGILGRVDAVYGSIECQKCGTLHGHFQVFVQCLHQFKPISSIAHTEEANAYTAHVTRMVCNDPGEWERQRDAVEAEWPEYRKSTLSLSRPDYQGDGKMSQSC
eukprot:2563678-Amphidinium_carterae.3